jgi:hypothetical protein
MRSLILADGDLAVREAALLHRLVIGLLDAGVHVAVGVPERVLSHARPSLGVEVLGYRLSGVVWTRALRARELLERFEAATAVSADDPAVVHAFGLGCVPMAVEVAQAAGASLVVDVTSRAMAQQVPGLVSGVPSHVLLAGSGSLASLLTASGAVGSSIRERPWGVSGSGGRRQPPRQGRAVSVVVGGAGRDRQRWHSAIRGLAAVAARWEEMTVFVDADASAAAGIGRLVGSLGMASMVSRVPDFESRRELVLQADILLWPERLGEVRSLVLDALACEMAVVAAEDPDVPALSRTGPARLVSGDSDELFAAVEPLVTDASARAELAASCRAYADQHHRAALHVTGVVDAYEWACGTASAGDGVGDARGENRGEIGGGT